MNKEDKTSDKPKSGNDFIANVIASCSREKIDSAIKEVMWKISEVEEHGEDSYAARELYHLNRDYERLLFAYNSL